MYWKLMIDFYLIITRTWVIEYKIYLNVAYVGPSWVLQGF